MYLRSTLTLLFVSIVVFVSLLLTAPAFAYLLIDSHGTVSRLSTQVLGDSDSSGSGSGGDDQGEGETGEDDEDNSGESEKTAEEEQQEAAKKEAERVRETTKESETESSTGVKTKLKREDDGRMKTEVRLQDGTRIKTETRAGGARTDVYNGTTKIRFEREGDRFRIKAENELGQEIELEEREGDDLDTEEDNEAELKGTLVKVDNVFQLTSSGVTYILLPTEGLVLDSLVGQFVEVEGIPTAESPTTLTITKAKLENTDETEDEIVVEGRADLLKIRALQNKAIIERLNVQALVKNRLRFCLIRPYKIC